MIIELVGPGAVGKTTLAPRLAKRLHIRYYHGQGFHRLDGTSFTRAELAFDRIAAVLSRRSLFLASFLGASNCRLGVRLDFSINLCRRDRVAWRSAKLQDGIIEGGPLHAICQRAVVCDHSLSRLASRITTPGIYVRLWASDDAIFERYLERSGSRSDAAQHRSQIQEYNHILSHALSITGRPVIDVDASGESEQVVEDVVGKIGKMSLWNPRESFTDT